MGINLGGEGADGGRVTAQNLNKILISKFMPDYLGRWLLGHYLRSIIHHRPRCGIHDATEELRLEVPPGQLQVRDQEIQGHASEAQRRQGRRHTLQQTIMRGWSP